MSAYIKQAWQSLLKKPYGFSLLLLVICLLLMAWLRPAYYRPSNIENNLRSTLPLIFAAVGQTLVVISGGIDLSIGPIVTLASVIMVQVLSSGESPLTILWAIGAGLAASVLAGAINGASVAYLRLQPIVATFATSFLWSGLALAVLPVAGGTMPEPLTSAVRVDPLLPFGAWVIIILLLCWVGFDQLPFTRHVYAVGGNSLAAYTSGVSVERVRFAAYVIAGACAGIGALLLTADVGTGDPLIGAPLTLLSVVALVIGGTSLAGGQGSIVGSIVGVLVITLLRNVVFSMGVPYLWQPFVDGTIILLVLIGPGLSLIRKRRLTI